MEDIAPALLEAIRNDFLELLGKAKVLEQTYIGAAGYAEQVGEALAEAFRRNITGTILPDGRMYWNIADRVVGPMLEQNHDLVTKAAAQAQQAMNEAAGIGLKAQTAPLNKDRVKNILDRVAVDEPYDNVAWVLDEPVKTFIRSVVDETLKANVEFQGRAGLSPKIVRRAEPKCCAWCRKLEGTYEYPDAPDDVYRRHNRCRCSVDYDPGDGRHQNVHTKKWTEAPKADKIKTKYAPSPQRQVKGLQVSYKKYAQLTGTMNTQYPGLTPEDGSRTIYDNKYSYVVVADGYGGLIIKKRKKI